MLVMVCYDVPDDRRRARVAKILEGHGERVQGSVFECLLDAGLWAQLRHELAATIDPLADRVHHFALCGKDRVACRRTGRGPLVDDSQYRVID